MKKGWQVKKLGDVCGLVRGPFGGSLKKNIFTKDGYAVYEQSHAIYDQFNDIRYYISESKSEDELRKIWSNPITRKALLEQLAETGYGKTELATIQTLIDAEKSDLFDVLEYIAFAVQPITREVRVVRAQPYIFLFLSNKQKEFLEFVLSKYIESGVEELDQEKLPELLELKYQALEDAKTILGSVENIRNTFIEFQKHLYAVMPT